MILVTGGAGYIGSHTVLNLSEKNEKIVIFDNLSSGHIETIEALKKINPEICFEKGDLNNILNIEQVFKNYDITEVIHFAAFSLVEESVYNPAKYYKNNVSGTLNLLDTMVKYNVLKIVFSSTAAIYGEPEYSPTDENHPKNPINPYGKTKLIIENIMDDYDKAYNLKSIRLRYFNVAGADEKSRIGEWHDIETHLIPNIIKSTYLKTEPFKIFGDDYNTPDGTCIRDYINVCDLADAHYLAVKYLRKENKTDVFNLGTKEGTSVKQIFELSKEILNKNINYEITSRREGDPAILCANPAKAMKILGWNISHTVKDSIKTAYLWEDKMQKNNNQ